MGLLDSAFSLPTLTSSLPLNQAVDYSLPSVGVKLNESFTAVQNTFGGTGQFDRQSQGAPSFASLYASAAQGVSAFGTSLADGLNTAEQKLKSFLSFDGKGGALKAAALGATTSSATASAIKQETGTDGAAQNTFHKVKLTASTNDGESTIIQNDVNFPVEPLNERVVEFDVTPEVTETRGIDYEALSISQMPGEFQKYKGTKSTQWQISATFTCRTRDEAHRNLRYLNTLRGWSMPYFGEKQRIQFAASGKLGAPPPVLQFSGWRGLVGTVPVVITSLSWVWPKDVDWIPTNEVDKNGQLVPFPTVMQVNIVMVESFSAQQFNGFDLVAFRLGHMVDAFSFSEAQSEAPTNAEPVGGAQGVTNGVPQASFNDRRDGNSPDQTAEAIGNTSAKATSGDSTMAQPPEQAAASQAATRSLIVNEINTLQAQSTSYSNAIDVGKSAYAAETDPIKKNEIFAASVNQLQIRDDLNKQIRVLYGKLGTLDGQKNG
jgi:hypothetical protein